jgi:uncharacterized membrane protein required for colicin V production
LEGRVLPAILNGINWIDIIFIILFIGMGYKGSRVGVGSQIFTLAGWVLILFVSIAYYGDMARIIFAFLSPQWAKPVSFLVIAATIFTVIKLIERLFVVPEAEGLAPIERIGGVLTSAIKAFLFFGVVGVLLLMVPSPEIHKAASVKSKTCMFFVSMDVKIYDWVASTVGMSGAKKHDQVMEDLLSD